jgi:PAS domain-containing protein
MDFDLTLAAAIVGTSVAGALIALILLSLIDVKGMRRDKPLIRPVDPVIEPAVFLFDDCDIVDSTGPARNLLSSSTVAGTDWDRLVAYLSDHFRSVQAEFADLAERGSFELTGTGDPPLRLRAEHLNGLARIEILDPSAEGRAVMVDALSHRAQEDELATLREALGAAPVLIWRQNAEGQVCWANSAYLKLVLARLDAAGEDLTWPLPALFDATRIQNGGTSPRRLNITAQSGGPDHWYDCTAYPVGDSTLHFAVPADAAVTAEQALREFVQTLTKTFAHLPIGLAIFDRQRQLALFNPALTDLTALGAEFLSARPTLFAFLDRLRETHVIPEPKDYRNWRQQMTELEKAASSGFHEETWSLPTGQTYRVTGRPHPDGAVAFLLEDISAEISLTRRFRTEIELGQSVIDNLDEAIAVFSSAGTLVMSNAAYGALWGLEPATTLGEFGILDSIRHWQQRSHPSPIWGEARDFVHELDERAEWDGRVTLTDGRVLACRFAPLAGDSTLVGFSIEDGAKTRVFRSRRASRPTTEGAPSVAAG